MQSFRQEYETARTEQMSLRVKYGVLLEAVLLLSQ